MESRLMGAAAAVVSACSAVSDVSSADASVTSAVASEIVSAEADEYVVDAVPHKQYCLVHFLFDGSPTAPEGYPWRFRLLADCAGMNIRIQKSALMTDVIRALGANPVEIDYRDVYDALERGTVDAAENNMPSYEAKKHYKLAKYYTLDEHMRIPEMQICSKVVWDMLSEEDRQIITECAKESAIYERELWIQREAKSKQIAMDNGTEVITVSIEEKREFRKAMEDVYQKYCGDDMDMIVKIMEY